MSLYLKRLEAGKFIWPVSQNGTAVAISSAWLSFLLEGIDWRNPRWTQRPETAGVFTDKYLFLLAFHRACGNSFSMSDAALQIAEWSAALAAQTARSQAAEQERLLSRIDSCATLPRFVSAAGDGKPALARVSKTGTI